MPNFLIIGAPKGGSTALYQYLREHPQIYMSPIKEPKFFALEGEKADFQGPDDWKKDYVTELAAYQDLFKDVSNEIAVGEASPGYLHSSKASERIKHHIPNAKLIAILRDPVDRAFSHFTSLVSQNLEPLTDFSEAMSAETERIQNNWSPRWCYKQRGFYYSQLKRYFNLFDRNQIKVYLYEDFKKNSLGVVQDAFSFLGVDNAFIPNVDHKHNVTHTRKNKALHGLINQENPIKSTLRPLLPTKLRQQVAIKFKKMNQGEKPQLSPEVRRQFVEIYREDILKLQDLINRDLSNWLEI